MRILGLLAVLLAFAQPAFADEAADAAARDCSARGYINRFEDAPTRDEMTCREIFRREMTNGKVIRVLADDNAARAPNGPMISAVRLGVDAAADLLERLPTALIGNVALLIYDGTASDVVDGESPLAKTAGARVRPECNITLYQRAEDITREVVAITVAHELFHCMQYATLSAAQMNTYNSGGVWWVEGVAETLADQAIPGTGEVTDRSDRFAESVRAHEALNQMGHESTPFFQWLVSKQGLDGLMTFQSSMARSGSASAQQAAMRNALGDEDWMAFAKAYADGDIVAADGSRLDTPAPEGDEITFTETRTAQITRRPFVLTLGKLRYTCGEWTNSVSPAGYLATKPAADWEDLPESINNFGDDAAPIPFVALNTGRSDARHEVTATLDTPCGACQDVAALDSCLVGDWVMTSGGPIEWMRENGLGRMARMEASEMSLRILRGGEYVLNPVTAMVEADNDGMQIRGDGDTQGSGGTWSAAEGVLHVCPRSGETKVTITTPETRDNMMFGPGREFSMDYVCSGRSLTTSLLVKRGLTPMVSVYTKR